VADDVREECAVLDELGKGGLFVPLDTKPARSTFSTAMHTRQQLALLTSTSLLHDTVAVRTHPHRIVWQNTTLSTRTQHAVDPETPETLTLAFNQPLLTKTQYCWSATHGPEERHEPHNTTNPHTVSEFEALWLRRSDTHRAL